VAPLAGNGPASSANAKSPAKKLPTDVGVKFETFVLQTFIDSMLPKNSTNLFGKGFAGEAWRSMLSEKLATQIAKNGGIGIAKTISESKQMQALLKADPAHVREQHKTQPLSAVLATQPAPQPAASAEVVASDGAEPAPVINSRTELP
jgi:Rod binding domain-containing protein